MGEVDADFYLRATVGRQPVRRDAVRAAAVQLRARAAQEGLRRDRALPLHRRDAVLRRCAGAASRGVPRPRRSAATSGLAAQEAPRSPFLVLNQERLLTGSERGQALLAEEEAARDALRAEARAIETAFEAEEQRLTEQRADAGRRPSSARSPTTSTPAWSRRGATRTPAPARSRRSLTSGADSSTLTSRRSSCGVMEPLRGAGDLRREQRAARRPVAQHHRRGHRRDRPRRRRAAGRRRRRRRPDRRRSRRRPTPRRTEQGGDAWPSRSTPTSRRSTSWRSSG